MLKGFYFNVKSDAAGGKIHKHKPGIFKIFQLFSKIKYGYR